MNIAEKSNHWGRFLKDAIQEQNCDYQTNWSSMFAGFMDYESGIQENELKNDVNKLIFEISDTFPETEVKCNINISNVVSECCKEVGPWFVLDVFKNFCIDEHKDVIVKINTKRIMEKFND